MNGNKLKIMILLCMVVAALDPSKPVTQFDMNSSYYTDHFVFARRFY